MAPVKQINLPLGNPEGELEMGDSTEPKIHLLFIIT